MLASSEAIQPYGQTFSRRAPLPLRHDGLWKIERGVVRTLSWLADGTPVTLGLWGQGDVVGRPLSQIDPFQIECLTRVEASLVSLAVMNHEPRLLITHIRQCEQFLIIRSHKRVDEMLIQLLTWLARRFGYEVEQGQVIDLRLTHQDMADMLGTTRVTVTRILKQYENQGLIQWMAHRQLVIKEESFWHYQI